MKVLLIEANTFEAMMERFDSFARKVNKLCCVHQDKTLQQWLDNQEVCQLLNISKRTLQTYRDNGTIAFMRVNHKMYYKPQDVQKIIPSLAPRQAQKRQEPH